MTDAKAPERIWADVIVWGDMEPLAGEWNCRDVGRTEDTEYIRKDLHDALAKERDELRAENTRLTAQRDQALSHAAVAAMEMRERAAEWCGEYHWNRYKTPEEGGKLKYPAVFTSHTYQGVMEGIRALPIPTDAQKALDEMLAKAREDTIREAADIANKNRDISGWVSHDAILALLTDGGRDE